MMFKLPIQYGPDLLQVYMQQKKKWLVVVIEPLFNYVQQIFSSENSIIVIPPGMDDTVLDSWASSLPGAEYLIGIGGGVCIDATKYLAWKRQLPFVLAPSAISVDAFLTDTIGIRKNGKVTYVGKVYPDRVLIDYHLIQMAPKYVNQAGAGDILSIHTALWDWRLAARQKGEHYNRSLVKQSENLLFQLDEAADEIYSVSNQGITSLVELYAAEVQICTQVGNSRPEEGSEHFWAYNLEYRTRKQFIHGEVITLGVLLMAALQKNHLTEIQGIIQKLGIRCHPANYGISRQELLDSLITAKAYVENEKLPYSVLNYRSITPLIAEKLLRQIEI